MTIAGYVPAIGERDLDKIVRSIRNLYENAPDSASVTAAAAAGVIVAPQGRVTLTTAVPVTSSDVAGATTVYYTPCVGRNAPIYSGTAFAMQTFSETSLALDNTAAHTGYQQSGKNFDLFLANNGGTIKLGTGPAWSTDTTRGTGAGTTEITQLQGIWVNANAITLRIGSAAGDTLSVAANQATYVGSLRTTADGITEDSAVKRFIYNAYNQTKRQLLRVDTTASWVYLTASYRQANGSTANQVEYLAGLTGAELSVQVLTVVLNSTATPRIVYAGVGIDSTTVNGRTVSGFGRLGDATLSSPGGPTAFYTGFAQLGWHYVAWLEKGAGVDSQTWFGLSSPDYQTGIFGSLTG